MKACTALLAGCLAILPAPGIAQSPAGDEITRGEYLFRISGCRHCHTADGSAPLAGGRSLETPFGTFYTPNITAHPKAGIGAWSADEFVAALRFGVSPDGSHYYPAFPFPSYTRMSEADARAIHDYILSQPLSEQPSREHDLAWYLRWRLAASAWQWLFFTPGELAPVAGASASLNRGRYIAEALGHCQECHTPRNRFGVLRPELAYAGNADGPEGEKVPNITSDPDAGIGAWSRESLETFLRFGERPDGEYTAGTMDAVIQGLGQLTDDDRNALIEYLRSLPPVDSQSDE